MIFLISVDMSYISWDIDQYDINISQRFFYICITIDSFGSQEEKMRKCAQWKNEETALV